MKDAFHPLPEPAADALDRIGPLLLQWYFRDFRQTRLAGGTALAVRWRHRSSTDIDLTMPADAFENVMAHHWNDIRIAYSRHPGLQWRLTGRSMLLRLDGAMLSLTATKHDPEVRGVTNRDIPVVAPVPILRGKLFGRMIGGGSLQQRDCYDLMYARRHHPGLFRDVCKALSDEQMDTLKRIAEGVSSGRVKAKGRPVLDASDPDIKRNMLEQFGEAVRETARDRAGAERGGVER